ncbi:MAG TPA: AMP-binding protein [Aggregicoccus sp.]|nr:AMP-binding protein [Aggregicoccus sp.]
MTRRLPTFRFPARTLPALLVHTAKRLPDKPFLRFLEPGRGQAAPRVLSFAAFARGVGRGAAFLRSAGVTPGERVLLLAENSPEWQLLALGTQLLRAEPAALFASLGAAPAQAIALRVRPRAVFVSTAEQWEKLRPVAAELAQAGLRAVVCAAGVDPAGLPEGVTWTALPAATGEGAADLAEGELEALAAAVGEEDPFLLLFTSGTTGRPKGVRLPQRSIVHAIEGGHVSTGRSEADEGLHLLPFAHVAGQDQFMIALAQGHGLIMISGRGELERALALGPTYLFSVPLVYERMKEGVEKKLAALPPPLRAFAHAALEAGARVRVDGSRSGADRLLTHVADRLVGKALRARLGGRMQGVFSGVAPASPALFRFFEGVGLPFVELYGLSETAGLVSSNVFAGPRRAGTVGLLSADHDVRFSDEGELLVRGPLLLSGFLEPEDAEGAYTPEGYFRTGDLAHLDDDGMLRVQGRKKSLLVLSTGKKLSPEPIEQAISDTPPFQGAVLLGEGKPYVTAVVFVVKEELQRLRAQGKDAAAELLPQVHAALHAFSDYERPKRLAVFPGAPSDYPELVTPTFKVKRAAVMAWLGPAAAGLY